MAGLGQSLYGLFKAAQPAAKAAAVTTAAGYAGGLALAGASVAGNFASHLHDSDELMVEIGNAKRYIKHLKEHIHQLMQVDDAPFCHLYPLVMYVNYMQVWMSKSFFQSYSGSSRKKAQTAIADTQVMLWPRWYRQELSMLMRNLVQEHQLLQDEVSRHTLGIRSPNAASCAREVDALKRQAWDVCKGCMARSVEFATWLEKYSMMMKEGLHHVATSDDGPKLSIARALGMVSMLPEVDKPQVALAGVNDAAGISYVSTDPWHFNPDELKFDAAVRRPMGDGPPMGSGSSRRKKKSAAPLRKKATRK